MRILLRVLASFFFYAGHRTKRESQMDMIDNAEGGRGVDCVREKYCRDIGVGHWCKTVRFFFSNTYRLCVKRIVTTGDL